VTASPLDGVRVLDLSRVISGPLCGRMLADMGADVVKVEPPSGDVTRGVPPMVDGFSAYFAQANAGKRNLCIDLGAPGGAATIARLAQGSDVLVENFRAGVLARHGLDADTLRSANPRLVYCSVTGWGQAGPWRDRRSYAPLAHAEVGSLELTARRRGEARPRSEVNQYADVFTALLAANAVLAALVQRGTTGEGQHLDVSLGEAATYTNEWAAAELQPPADGFGGFDTWNHRAYRLADGSFVAILGNPIDAAERWADALGGEEALTRLRDDPRLVTREARARNLEAVIDFLDGLTSRFDDASQLEAAVGGPTVLVAPIRSLPDLAATEWAETRDLFTEVHPGLPVPTAPWRSDNARVGARPLLSALGADNREVLLDWGFEADEIDRLEADGALSGTTAR
jgi:crotonobetainyl-CoA:carnitine CoA-transferase CaiB-like acyl-CoA transferase